MKGNRQNFGGNPNTFRKNRTLVTRRLKQLIQSVDDLVHLFGEKVGKQLGWEWTSNIGLCRTIGSLRLNGNPVDVSDTVEMGRYLSESFGLDYLVHVDALGTFVILGTEKARQEGRCGSQYFIDNVVGMESERLQPPYDFLILELSNFEPPFAISPCPTCSGLGFEFYINDVLVAKENRFKGLNWPYGGEEEYYMYLPLLTESDYINNWENRYWQDLVQPGDFYFPSAYDNHWDTYRDRFIYNYNEQRERHTSNKYLNETCAPYWEFTYDQPFPAGTLPLKSRYNFLDGSPSGKMNPNTFWKTFDSFSGSICCGNRRLLSEEVINREDFEKFPYNEWSFKVVDCFPSTEFPTEVDYCPGDIVLVSDYFSTPVEEFPYNERYAIWFPDSYIYHPVDNPEGPLDPVKIANLPVVSPPAVNKKITTSPAGAFYDLEESLLVDWLFPGSGGFSFWDIFGYTFEDQFFSDMRFVSEALHNLVHFGYEIPKFIAKNWLNNDTYSIQ